MGKLSGKSILVTGGSRGIGAAICKELAHEGARVALTYASHKEPAEQVLSEMEGEGHLCLPLSLENESSIETTIQEALKTFDKLDGLVNNAGITKDQILLRMKIEEFDKVIQTNLRGTFICTKSALKPMIKARSGSIVNITSVIGQMGNAGQANYAASKAGIEAFTKSVAKEVGSRGIRLNCVAPGFIVTEMTDKMTEEQKNQLLKNLPLQRMGTTEDVAKTVSFLLSDESSYITGQTISVNGGLYM